MSRLIGKPTIGICKNKEADQLRGNREADLRLCFRYMDRTLPYVIDNQLIFSSSAVFWKLIHSSMTGKCQGILFPSQHGSPVRCHLGYPLCVWEHSKLIISLRMDRILGWFKTCQPASCALSICFLIFVAVFVI